MVWLPSEIEELAVVNRILDLIETTPAMRIARMLNDEKVPSPKAGRVRTRNGVQVENSGLWTQNTIKGIATHSLLIALWEYGKRSEGDQLRFTPSGPRQLRESDYHTNGKLKRVANPADGIIRTPAKSKAVTTPEKLERIKKVIEHRGRHLKGKAHTRKDVVNPLGGRIYDLTCGWPMYRYAKRGNWCYTCGLYQNSEAKRCEHNTVRGEVATRFVLSCLRQRLLQPSTVAKLKTRLLELATVEQGEDPGERQLNADRAELAAVKRKLPNIERNMAFAETREASSAIAVIFQETKAQEARLEQRIAEARPTSPKMNPEREVEAALGLLDRLTEFAEVSPTNISAVGEAFTKTNAKLYLEFQKVQRGRREFSVPAGGVLTFGSASPPKPLYTGPTDRAIIRKMLATGESVTAIPEPIAPEDSNSGQDVMRSANVQRVTRRCT